MRTTVTLDDDVIAALRTVMRELGKLLDVNLLVFATNDAAP